MLRPVIRKVMAGDATVPGVRIRKELKVRKRGISKMPVFYIVTVLAVAGMLMLTGCGSKASDGPETDTVDEKIEKLTKAIDRGKSDKYFRDNNEVIDVEDGGSESGDAAGIFGGLFEGGDTDDADDADDTDDTDEDAFDPDADPFGKIREQGLESEHNDYGYYYMYSFGDSDGDHTREELEEAGIIFYLMLEQDGTGYIYMMGEKFDLTWDDSCLYVDTKEKMEKLYYFRSGDYLTMSDDDGYFIFEYYGKSDRKE